MPQDSTALDFAFSLHTDIGTHCIGAKVNHKLVPLSHRLKSGDQVEILTSKAQRIQPEWENFVTTARAKAKINEILRREAKINQQKGETILRDFLQKEGIPFDASAIDRLTNLHNFHTPDELMVAIGCGKLALGDADRNLFKEKAKNWKKLLSFSFGKENKDAKEEPRYVENKSEKIDTKKILKLTEEAISKEYIMAECCHPIPGDDVLGYVEDDETVVVHKRECPVAMRLKSSFGPRLVSTQWEASKSLSFPAKIEIQGIDRMGILNEITRVISNELMLDMRGLTIQANEGVFDGTVNIMVHDTQVVESLCNKLRKIKGVQKAARCKE